MIVKIKKLPVSKLSSRKDVKKRLEVGDGAKGSPRRLPKKKDDRESKYKESSDTKTSSRLSRAEPST